MAASGARFACLNDEEFDLIIQDKDSKNTIKATKMGVTIFREYLMEKGLPNEFERLDKSALATILSKFYLEVRKSDGQQLQDWIAK